MFPYVLVDNQMFTFIAKNGKAKEFMEYLVTMIEVRGESKQTAQRPLSDFAGTI